MIGLENVLERKEIVYLLLWEVVEILQGKLKLNKDQ